MGTRALYYPTIDITNEQWLKNAILFWDEIHTIVPYSLDNPYQNNTTQYLHENGVLRPFSVNPDNSIINDLTDSVMDYLNTNEGFQLLTNSYGRRRTIHRSKLPRGISRMFDLHPEKLSHELQYQLRNCVTGSGWLELDENFIMFYMTLLANRLCEQNSLSLLTDNSPSSNFSDLVRLDNQMGLSGGERDYWHHSRKRDRGFNLEQGIMINLIIKSINLSEMTTLDDILNYKSKHQNELGRFRTPNSNQ